MLGHELRNPLAPLSAGIELLQQPAIGFESIVKVRAMMKRQLDHLSRLVEDLLDLARISRGEVVLRKVGSEFIVRLPLGGWERRAETSATA